MITFRKTQTRPATDVKFLSRSDDLEFSATIDQFVAEGKILGTQDTLSEDQLTKTTLITFLDDETFLMFRHHPSVVRWGKNRKKHDFEHSILTDIDFV